MRPIESTALTMLLDCITDVKQWLAQSFLHLNDRKTECIVFVFGHGQSFESTLGSDKLLLILVMDRGHQSEWQQGE